MFSVCSVPRCYNQDQLGVAISELVEFSRCDLVLFEAWECLLLEAATKQTIKDSVRACVRGVCVWGGGHAPCNQILYQIVQ
jgi:hypothetical protein